MSHIFVDLLNNMPENAYMRQVNSAENSGEQSPQRQDHISMADIFGDIGRIFESAGQRYALPSTTPQPEDDGEAQ